MRLDVQQLLHDARRRGEGACTGFERDPFWSSSEYKLQDYGRRLTEERSRRIKHQIPTRLGVDARALWCW